MDCKLCIFDLDGTLTDTIESLHYSVNATLQELGMGGISQEQCKQFVGNGARVLMERALKSQGDVALQKIEQAMDIYGRIFNENCTYHVVPYDGIKEMLRELKDRGIWLAVLSNKPQLQTETVVKRILGEEWFEQVYGQREGVPRKPDPQVAWEIAESFGLSPEESAYIGDSDVDVHTGRNAGMRTIAVSWGFRTVDQLKQAGAEMIVDRPEEIIRFMD